MDVSQSDSKLATVAPLLDGPKLLKTVVSLTGLPEEMVYEELDQILKLKEPSGEQEGPQGRPLYEDLTLEGLRAAMLEYLETIQADLGESSAVQPDPAESHPT